MSNDNRVQIISFDPLTVAIPNVARFVGCVWLGLPAVHLNLYDLSLGIEELRGAHIGADAEMFGLEMTLPEPGITREAMLNFVMSAENELREMWHIVNDELARAGALLGEGRHE